MDISTLTEVGWEIDTYKDEKLFWVWASHRIYGEIEIAKDTLDEAIKETLDKVKELEKKHDNFRVDFE